MKRPAALSLPLALVLSMSGGSLSEAVEATPNEVHSAVDNRSSETVIMEILQQALSTGIPLFNDGNHQGCADVYEQATQALQEEDLRALHQQLVDDALQQAPEDAKEKAWHYRRLFDRIQADVTFQPLREADLPEGFPEQGPVGAIVRKQYPSYRMAMSTGRAAFGKLFRHIQRRGIPMTAPVEMAQPKDGPSMMGFLYEDTKQGTLGEQDNITVVDMGEKAVLSMTIRGRRSNQVFSSVQELIMAYALNNDLAIGDDWRVLGYSSPMVPRERQYYEIQVSIESDLE